MNRYVLITATIILIASAFLTFLGWYGESMKMWYSQPCWIWAWVLGSTAVLIFIIYFAKQTEAK